VSTAAHGWSYRSSPFAQPTNIRIGGRTGSCHICQAINVSITHLGSRLIPCPANVCQIRNLLVSQPSNIAIGSRTRLVGQRVNLCIRSPTISRPSAEPFNSTARTDNSIRRIPGAP